MSSADVYDVMNPACPTQQVIGQVGQKWAALTMYALEDRGVLRFGELRSLITGVSQKMLTQTLRQLERDGFVTRTAIATVPVTVEYRLTPLGVELAGVVGGIRRFAYARMHEIEVARSEFDQVRGLTGVQPPTGLQTLTGVGSGGAPATARSVPPRGSC